MILDLMRAQAAAHRGYLVSTAAILTLGVALAGYAAFSAAQQDAVDAHAATAYGLDGEWRRSFAVDGTDTLPLTELGAALDAADAEGAGTAAMLHGFPIEVIAPFGQDIGLAYNVGGLRGAVDWELLLTEGDAPGPGQIAIAASSDSRVQIGDTLTVAGDSSTSDGAYSTIDLGTFEVSGFLRDGAEGRYAVGPLDAVLEWDDAVTVWHTWKAQESRAGDFDWSATTVVGAQVATESLTDLRGPVSGSWSGPLPQHSSERLQVLAVTAIVLPVGMIGMVFAVGRAQAQARSRWVATARVLGARRSTIAAATVGEVLLVGLVAGVAGTAIAWGAVALEYSAFAADNPDALIPAGMDVGGWLVLAIGALGLVMAAILGAIPAFWAARVTPAAALKPVTPVIEEPAGPRVRSAWIYGVWAALFLALVVLAWPADLSYERRNTAWVLALAVIVASVPMLMRAARDLVARAGRALARSSVPWEMPAGDALLGRLRLAAIPAGVVAIGTAALTAAVAWHVLATVAGYTTAELHVSAWGWLPAGFEVPAAAVIADVFMAVAITGIAALVLVAFAAFASSVRASAAEDDARRALGLSTGTARAAMALRFTVPLLVGVGLGMATGLVGVLLTFHGAGMPQALPLDFTGTVEAELLGPTWALAHAGSLTAPMILMALTTLVCIAFGAGLAAATMVRSSQARKETVR
ncbi:FtsX-like permease family protein [Demequina mangrovi]|uniref:FtsX-like permease family protein n=1 Tax=Demequina mangrovi TaxID=1043493 RepID=A0A1H7AJA4_9MICO|nr:FtsX-like permease family protein [Demequina mangrovi]SEJ62162.1 FtsX-like permease family protein [Demequina mangrovi]